MDCLSKEHFFRKLPPAKRAKDAIFIMRGLPGCGKSGMVKAIHDHYYPICYIGDKFFPIKVASADDFFMVNGEYKYDRSKIGQAHDWCFQKFLDYLKIKPGPYFVDNTNTSIKEIDRYVSISKSYSGYVYLITLDIDVKTSIKRNVHKVPEKTIEAMYSRIVDADVDNKLTYYVDKQKIKHLRLVTM